MSGARLDTALVQRGLARSRTHAARLIADARVTIEGLVVSKPSRVVTADTDISIGPGADWASRGAHKLLGALDACGIDVLGRRALDAGASTGGFTDVLLQRGAVRVAAVDVGAGQLIPRLAHDPRVSVHDHVNVRNLSRDERGRAAAAADAICAALGGSPEIVVADLSFISLCIVLPALVGIAAPTADLLPMVKPQFEVGKGRLGARGVVRDHRLRAAAVLDVIAAAAALGWGVVAVTPSVLPGPNGNVEFFVHLRHDAVIDAGRAHALTLQAVEDQP